MSYTFDRATQPDAVQQHFDLFLQHTTEGVWDWVDLDAQEQWWSPRFYELLGYRDQEIESSLDTFERLLHPEDAVQTMLGLRSALENTSRF
ncbi:MAG: PAS domain-containing protein [Gimesia chilikensis]